MQIICPISGVRMIQAPYMLGLAYAEVHPIFRMSRKDLLGDVADLLHRFTRASSAEEKKLYFLGVLNCTDLVQFTCIATPSLQTCEKNFIPVLDLAAWIDFAYKTGSKKISFPSFVVREDNKDLQNIKDWIRALEDIRKDALDKESATRMLNDEYQRLRREFENARLKDRAFTPAAAKWALEMAELDEEHNPKGSLYYKVLTSPLKDAWGIDRYLIEELKDLLSDNLPLSHDMVPTVLGQVAALLAANKKGMQEYEIVFSDREETEEEKADKARYKDVYTSTQIVVSPSMYRERFEKEYGEFKEPKESNFTSRIAFLKAKAIWDLANKKAS